MVLAWQIPAGEQNFLVNHFQWLQLKHAVTLLIGEPRGKGNEGHILIYGNEAWIILWKDGQFELAKPVSFLKPEDLSWHILNTCRVLQIEPSAISWKVTGMVEEGSALWQGITRFLPEVIPMETSGWQEKEIPGHYFAHLFKSL